MNQWKELTIQSEEAKRLFLKDRKGGEKAFSALMQSYPKDGMVHLKYAEANEAIQEFALASKHFHLAEQHLPMEGFKEKARKGWKRVDPSLPSVIAKDNDSAFEIIKPNLPPAILKAVQDGEANLQKKEYKNMSIDIGQTGVRTLIMHLMGKHKIQVDQDSNWEARSRALADHQIIDPIAQNQLKMVRDIRNNIANKEGIDLTTSEAKACLDTFKAALVRIFQEKTPSGC
jgi:predicted transcriptional regulator